MSEFVTVTSPEQKQAIINAGGQLAVDRIAELERENAALRAAIDIGTDMQGFRLDFTDEQLRAIYDRIELIDQHFEKCCGFHHDLCRYGEEFDELYKRLILAGMPDHKTPCNRSYFEQWMEERKNDGDQ